MRLRGPLVITGALGLAILTVSLVAVWTSVDHTRAIRAQAADGLDVTPTYVTLIVPNPAPLSGLSTFSK